MGRMHAPRLQSGRSQGAPLSPGEQKLTTAVGQPVIRTMHACVWKHKRHGESSRVTSHYVAHSQQKGNPAWTADKFWMWNSV
eukprot:1177142-Prorocentrum_minimum.AAC.4